MVELEAVDVHLPVLVVAVEFLVKVAATGVQVVVLVDVKMVVMEVAPAVPVDVLTSVRGALVVVPVGAGLDARGLARILVRGVLIHVNLNVGVRVRLAAGELPSSI